MQNVEIEIMAIDAQDALEASIDQTAEKYAANEPIQVQRYFINQMEANSIDFPNLHKFRVSIDFETDPALFDYSLTEEGGVAYLY